MKLQAEPQRPDRAIRWKKRKKANRKPDGFNGETIEVNSKQQRHKYASNIFVNSKTRLANDDPRLLALPGERSRYIPKQVVNNK